MKDLSALIAAIVISSLHCQAQQKPNILTPRDKSRITKFKANLVILNHVNTIDAESKIYIQDTRKGDGFHWGIVAIVDPISKKAYVGRKHGIYALVAQGIAGVSASASGIHYSRGITKSETAASANEAWKILDGMDVNADLLEWKSIGFTKSITDAFSDNESSQVPRVVIDNANIDTKNQLTVVVSSLRTHRSAQVVIDTTGKEWTIVGAKLDGQELDLEQEESALRKALNLEQEESALRKK